MKNIFIFTTFLIASLSSFSQHFSVSGTDTIFYGDVADSDFAAKFILFNDSTASFPMTWEMESESMATGWEYSICDPADCHAIGVEGASFTLSTSTSNRIMNIHYFPNGNFGESTVVVKLWENALPQSFILLKWTGVVSGLGADDEKIYNAISAYYNSMAGSISIQYDLDLKTTDSQIVLFNLEGKKIDEIQLVDHAGVITIGDNLAQGAYIYTLISNNKIITSKKVVVQ